MMERRMIVVTLGNTHPRLVKLISNTERAILTVKSGYARLEFDGTILYRIKLETFTNIYNALPKEQKI